MRLRRSAVQIERPGHRPLVDVDHAHDHRRLARPFEPLASRVDRAAVVADPAQAGRARVTLADRVRGDQTEGALGSNEVESTAEEVGDQVGVAVRFGMNGLEPVGIALGVTFGHRVLARRTAGCRRSRQIRRRPRESAIRPARRPRKTSGNSISQWNGSRGGSIPRKAETGCSMSPRRTSRVGMSIASFR